MSRLEQEDGITLIELLVTVAIGIVVFSSVLTLVDASVRSADRTTDRAEVSQRGRTAMNLITRKLRSQVCPDPRTPPVKSGDGTSMVFYSDTDGVEAFGPRAVRIFLDSGYKGGRGAIKQWIYPGTDTSATPEERVLIEDVLTVASDKPLFTYYSFNGAKMADTLLDTTVGSPLPADSKARVLSTEVQFRVYPSKPTNATGAPSGNQLEAARDSDFLSRVWVRNSDYTDRVAANNDRLWGARCT